MVSVCMITYNHSDFIAQAIEGVLMQKTNFDFELIIADDFSTDNTRKICLDYYERHPNTIKLVLNNTNIGMMPNFIKALGNCTEKYTALCEGDDYWTDPFKLQKQIDFLEKNENYNLCFHLGIDYHQEKGIYNYEFINKQELTFYDFASKGCFPKTMSAVFRNSENLRQQLTKPWVLSSFGADYLIYLLNTTDGSSAFYLKEHMGVYRIHSTGIWTNRNFFARWKGLVKNIILYKNHLPLTCKQRLYLNWQLKFALINLLYYKNNGIRWYINKIINRVLFISGPGIISGVITNLLYSLVKKRWGLYLTSNNIK